MNKETNSRKHVGSEIILLSIVALLFLTILYTLDYDKDQKVELPKMPPATVCTVAAPVDLCKSTPKRGCCCDGFRRDKDGKKITTLEGVFVECHPRDSNCKPFDGDEDLRQP